MEKLREFGKLDVIDDLSEDQSEDGDDDEEHDDDDDGSEEADEEEEDETDDNYDQYVESETEEAGDEVSFLDHLSTTKSLNSSLETSVNSFTNNLNSSVYYDGEISRPNTVETFCNTPNPNEAMFNALEENDKVYAFQNFLKVCLRLFCLCKGFISIFLLQTFSDEEYLIYLVFAILKCSAISKENKEALEVSQALYKDCFEYATKTNQVNGV